MMKKIQSMALSLMAIGLIQLSFFQLNASEIVKPVPESGAYFPASLLNEMIYRKGCDGIRFYNVEAPNGGESILAVCTSGGADMAVEGKNHTYYQLYEGIDGTTAVISTMNQSDARDACTNLAGGAYAVTFSNRDIESMLGEEGAKGIKLVPSSLQTGEATLTAYSATISGGSAVSVPNGMSMINPSPCPSACGSNPAQGYLINFME